MLARPGARRRRAPGARRTTSPPTTVVLGALAARDWRPMHHDHHFAVNRNGVRDIFLNTPNQAAWFERFVTDWTGPKGRLGRHELQHAQAGVPRRHDGDRGHRRDVETSTTPGAVGWSSTSPSAVGRRRPADRMPKRRVALPTSPDDNPWAAPRRRLETADGSRLHHPSRTCCASGRRRVRAPLRRSTSSGRWRTTRSATRTSSGSSSASSDLLGCMLPERVRRQRACRCSTAWSSTRSSAARSRRRRTS